MIAVLEQPLVRAYLEQLDRALTVLPKAEAAELREQITAHLREALQEDSNDAAVRTVLDSLGTPADLVAEADGLSSHVASTPEHRSRLSAVKGRTWVAVLIVLALAIAIIVIGAVVLVPRYRAGSLVCDCSMGWSDPTDARAQALTRANSRSQSTVPMRVDGQQAIDIGIFNPTRYTQTVLGLPTDADGSTLGPLGPSGPFVRYRLQLTTAEPPRTAVGPVGLSDHFPIAIPPGGTRTIRLQWGRLACHTKGTGVLVNDIQLRVRVGWFTRTETIDLPMTLALTATTTTQCTQTAAVPTH